MKIEQIEAVLIAYTQAHDCFYSNKANLTRMVNTGELIGGNLPLLFDRYRFDAQHEYNNKMEIAADILAMSQFPNPLKRMPQIIPQKLYDEYPNQSYDFYIEKQKAIDLFYGNHTAE